MHNAPDKLRNQNNRSDNRDSNLNESAKDDDSKSDDGDNHFFEPVRDAEEKNDDDCEAFHAMCDGSEPESHDDDCESMPDLINSDDDSIDSDEEDDHFDAATVPSLVIPDNDIQVNPMCGAGRKWQILGHP